ncbi:MAG: hypothetical protein EBR82_21230 [Caulobacteraceae bacterium]|nr:hypothetical protein [Caulobacteraceae bacterium]
MDMVYFFESMSELPELGSIQVECAELRRMNASVVPDPKAVADLVMRPDIRSAIDALTEADHARLALYAGAFAVGSRLDAHDIYNSSIMAALDGTRVWPPDLDLVPFLKMSMRSIASNEKKKGARSQLFPVGGDEEGLGDLTETSASISDEGAGAIECGLVDALDSKRLLEEVFALFEDDLDAQMVIMARLEDKDAPEIKLELDMNDTRYASINRKIKRRLIALANPKGTN